MKLDHVAIWAVDIELMGSRTAVDALTKRLQGDGPEGNRIVIAETPRRPEV